MSRPFRLTGCAEDSLIEIARWTIQTFGQRQADIYETELINRCEEITNGEDVSQSCATLIENSSALRFTRAGEHFVVYLDHTDEVIIVDILHSRSDLAHHISALSSV